MRQKDQKPRILMADDDMPFHVIMHRLLDKNFDLTCYSRGEWLLEKLTDEPPDLIILDVNMPTLSGFDVCRQIRSKRGFSSVPVVFLTGSLEESDRIKGKLAEGTEYLLKPFTAEFLMTKLRQFLKITD